MVFFSRDIELVEPGTHLCFILQSDEERVSGALPFLKWGLENGERCVYLAEAEARSPVLERLRQEEVPVEVALDTLALIVKSPGNFFQEEGISNAETLGRSLTALSARTTREGFLGLRLVIDMTWGEAENLFPEDPGMVAGTLAQFFLTSRARGLCEYDLRKISPGIVRGLVNAHTHLLHAGKVTKNWFFVSPQESNTPPTKEGELKNLIQWISEMDRLKKDLFETKEDLVRKSESLNPPEKELPRIPPPLGGKPFPESENEFQHLANITQEGIFALSQEGNFHFVNPRFAEILGFSVDELNHRPLFSILGEDAIEKAKKRLERRKNGIAETFEVELRKKNGEPLTAQVTSAPIMDRQKGYLGAVGVVSDITARKKAERDLRRSEEKYRLLFERAPVPIALTTPEGKTIDANPALLKQSGYSKEEFLALHALALYENPETRGFVAEALGKTGRLVDYELTVKGKDGTVYHAIANVEKAEMDGQQTFLTFIQDISSRKKMEVALRESQEKYKALVENSLVGIALFKGEQLVFANQAIVKLLGYERLEDFLDVPFLSRLSPDSQREFIVRLKKFDRGGDLAPVWSFSIRRKDGSFRSFEAQTTPIILDGERCQLSMMLDITEKIRAETTLLETTQILETIFSATHIHVALLDKDFNYIKVNKAFAERGKKHPSFFPGKNHFSLPTCGESRELFEKVMKTGEPAFIYAQPCDHPDNRKGEKTFWDLSLIPLKAQNKVTGLVFNSIDVTNRIRAIRESEERFRFAFENAREAILWADTATGCIANLNHAAENLFEMNREEILGKHFTFLHPAEMADEVTKKFELVATNPQPVDVKILTKSGRVIAVRIFVSSTRFDNKDIVQGIFHDMSQTIETQEIIRKQESFLSTVIDSLTHPFFVIDAKTLEVKLANKSARESQPKDIFCSSLPKGKIQPCDGGFNICPIREVLKTRRSVTMEHQRLSQGGKPTTVAVFAHPVFDENQEVVQIIEYAIDTTDRKNAELALEWELNLNAGLAALARDLISPKLELQTITQTVVQYAQTLTGSSFGFVDFLKVTFHRDRGLSAEIEKPPETAITSALIKLSGKCHDPFYSNNPGDEFSEMNLFTRQKALKNVLIFPVRLGKTNYARILLANAEKPFSKKELDAVRRLSELFALAITRMLNEREIRHLTENLEEKITERTAQLEEAIADLELSNQQLQALTTRINQVREEERTEIARFIHDDLGQLLSAIKVDLAWMREISTKPGPGFSRGKVLNRLEETREMLDEALLKARTLAQELKPHVLENLGLLPAIDWQMEKFQVRTGLKCSVKYPAHLELPRNVSLAIFRILQEALTNIMRHARAKKVKVKLRVKAGKFTMEVQDDGIGFRPMEGGFPKSLGILGMEQHAKEFNGSLEFLSPKEKGTLILLTIPFSELKHD